MNSSMPQKTKTSNKPKVRKISASAIADSLYPAEARCLLNKDYVKMMILAGRDWQAVLDESDEVLRQTCTHCHQLANKEGQTANK